MSDLMLLGVLLAEMVDLDGGAAEDEMMRLGVLEVRTVTEPCGECCKCVGVVEFPATCYFVAADVEAEMEARLSRKMACLKT